MLDFLTELGIYKVLKSKRFTVALITAIVYFIGLQLPIVQEFATEITALAIGFVVVLVGGYSVEDAARAGREAQLPATQEDAIRNVFESLLYEYTVNRASAKAIEDAEVG